jgi:hypothetical protein
MLLSESFIERHSDKLSWNFISECQKLSEEFIIKHIDKIDMEGLKKNIFIEFKIDIKYLTEENEESDCCIMYEKTKLRTIKCNHVICQSCFEMLTNKRKCPYCRQKLESKIEFS